MKSAGETTQVTAQPQIAVGETKENNLSSVQEQIDLAVTKAVEGYEEKVSGLEAALEAAKNQASDLAAKLEEIQAMQTGEETGEGEMDKESEEMPDEVAAAMEEMPDEVAKSISALPAEQRDLMAKAFKAQADEVAKATAEVRKEREVRLDAEAITKSKETYKHVGIEHEVVAPALRRLAEVDSELAKSVENVLNAAEAQISESGLLKEFGTANTSTSSVIEEAKSLAKSLVESGVVKTLEQGVERVLDTNPELAKRYAQEGAN
jgi:DNA repair photolyase